DLVEVARVFAAGQLRRGTGSQVAHVANTEGRRLAPVGHQSGKVARWRLPPQADLARGAEGGRASESVVAPPGQETVGDVAAQRDAARFGGAGRNGVEGAIEDAGEASSLPGIEAHEHAVGGDGDGDIGVDVVGGAEANAVGGV